MRAGRPLGAPRRQPVLVAFGEPIEVGDAKPNPTQEEVVATHAALMRGFTKTFDEHKHEYGWGERELKLV